MKTITYNLNQKNQDDYYPKIRKFTSDILNESKITITHVINDFQKFLCENPPENLYINEDFTKKYNYEEHVFELLFIGVMWKNYINVAINLDPYYQNILAKLVDIRNKKDKIILEDNENLDLKEKIDKIRGPLATKHLLNEDVKKCINKDYGNDNNYNNEYLILNDNKNRNNFNIKNYILLLNYLKATGDYEESLKHLLIWKEFFQKNHAKLATYFKNILSFTNSFEKIANDELYGYIPNVDNFRENQLENHRNNEDIVLCARNSLEYYLNMFGAEIMNRVFRYKFLKRDKIIIILPNCMQLQNNFNKSLENKFNLKIANETKYNHDEKSYRNINNNENINNSPNHVNNLNHQCKASQDHLGLKCIYCNEECNIGKINKLVKEKHSSYNINVYISAHTSSILSNITKEDEEKLAIVGVACINNLIEGGWKISSSGIPAQCVILDYVGCLKHWDDGGFSTNFNISELNRILTRS